MAFSYAIAVCVLTAAGGIAHVTHGNLKAVASQAPKDQTIGHTKSVASPAAPVVNAPAGTPTPSKVATVSVTPPPQPTGSVAPAQDAKVAEHRTDVATSQGKDGTAKEAAKPERAAKANEPSGATKYEEMQRALHGFVTELGKLSDQYQTEIKASKCVRLLETDRLTADENFAESDKMVAGARSAFQHHVSGLANLLNTWIPRMTELGWGEEKLSETKEAEYREVINEMTAHIKAGVVNEKETLDCLVEAVSFLKEKRSGWVTRNHQFYFYRSSDSDRFSAIVAKNHDALARQERLVAKLNAESGEIEESLKSARSGR
jgi:hypothetical protein